jgi:hypothetical protein
VARRLAALRGMGLHELGGAVCANFERLLRRSSED